MNSTQNEQFPVFSFPNPLVREDGTRIESVQQWPARHAEITHGFGTQMYGAFPPGADTIEARVEVREVAGGALEGKATRKQIRLHFAANGHELAVDVLLYIPNEAPRPVPAFLGLNFFGNHTTHNDPDILLPQTWVPDIETLGATGHYASEAGRGAQASRWQMEKVIERGYASATVYCGDLDPDFDDGFANGVHPLFYREGQTRPEPDEWGTIGAWAWGLSRVLDYLETVPEIDDTRVAITGHSRLGKAALWAGASDDRFALVISNESGCGGAAISRSPHDLGEPDKREKVARITTAFPHWFCGNFKAYGNREDELPFDQHMLLALIAPRPVYVASAAEDLWAYPAGEFYSALHVGPVYEMFGKKGLPVQEMPAIGQPVMGTVGYHIRSGKHDVTEYDWEQFLAFADLHLKAQKGV